jgi:hypothetical protein
MGPANAMVAHATRTIPDRRIRMCRPPRPLSGPDYHTSQAGRVSPRRGQYRSRAPMCSVMSVCVLIDAVEGVYLTNGVSGAIAMPSRCRSPVSWKMAAAS